MKKFSLMMIAAFIAVFSWASQPVEGLVKKAPMQLSGEKIATVRQFVPGKKATTLNVQASATNRMVAKAKASMRKAPKKAGVADLLSKQWMLISNNYTVNDEGSLEKATPFSDGTVVSFSLIDATSMTIGIDGFIGNADQTLQATVSTEVSEELQAQGVAAVLSVADGQTLIENYTTTNSSTGATTEYGPVVLSNALNPGNPLEAYVYSEGYIVIDGIWVATLTEGNYAGMPFTNYCTSMVVPVNGKMAWGEGDAATEVPVFLLQESDKEVSVYNFGGYGTAITVTMKEDHSFVINEQIMFYYNSTYGYVYLSGLDDGYLTALTGTGAEDTLTFGMQWVLYVSYNGKLYTFGSIESPATITLTEGEFTYPVIENVAATPADPKILGVGNYDSDKGYGYVAFTIPTTDVDGNDLKESELYYQFYSDIAGDIQPITFTTDLYVKLEEDMSIIPYAFTDSYDFVDNGTYKMVFMNYEFDSMYDRIGVKSIYTGGDETNESEIVWAEIEKPITEGDFTFNFNELGTEEEPWPVSTNLTKDGDITEENIDNGTIINEFTEGDVTLTISPSTTNTPNRYWSTTAGPQLRVYSGTLTFTVPEGNTITKIVFNHNGKWGANTVDGTEIANDAETNAATWTGSAQTVVVTIAANSQINSITVTVESNGGDEPVVEDDVLVTLPEGVETVEYTLDLTGYTSQAAISDTGTKLVAFDGDDVYLQGLAYYFPEAYVKGTRNAEGQYVVKSGQFVGEDEYGKEYIIGLSVDDENNFFYEDEIVFDFNEETGVISLVEGTYYGESESKSEPSVWDYFEAAVYTPGTFVLPDVVELPEGAEVETWYLSASDSDDAAVNGEVGVAIVGNEIYVQGLCSYLPDAWVKGTIDGETATFPAGQFYGTYADSYYLFFAGMGDNGAEDVVFDYDAENGVLTTATVIALAGDANANKLYDYYYDVLISRDRPEAFPVEVPEGLETEVYNFKANVVKEDESGARRAEANTDVTFDFNTMKVATSNNGNEGDITKPLALTEGNVTLTVSPKDESSTTPNRFWNTNNGPQLRVYSGTLTFEVPEGSTMTQIAFNAGKWNDKNSADTGEFEDATWTGNAQKVVVTIAANTQINNIVVTVAAKSGDEPGDESGDEPGDEPTVEEYSYQIQVGFDGNDVYFSGMNDNCADMWMKGTLSEDGKTVTIPANQYMGGFSFWGLFTFDYYITAMDETGDFADIVLNWDADNFTFTTDQTVVLNGYKDEWDPYQTFINVVITKMEEFAATPADPTFESFKIGEQAGYSKIYAEIPTKDVDGNDLIASNLFYIVWFEKDGVQQPYTFAADLYAEDFDEDVTEVPYNHDGYDVYKGGEIIYLEDEIAELESWTKVGIQSVYYGGGERNVSNIVWNDGDVTTGIANVKSDNSKSGIIYDLQGRRVIAPAKGLYIKDGKKVVIK